ncbi:MAG TPA: polyprenyl synthetase family protein [Acidimicrobiia bacterium]
MDLPLLTDLVDVPRVWDRLSAVERRLGEVTEASTPFLTEIAQHGLQAGGKRYRPLLTQVAAELGPNPGAEPVEAGVAVELVHLGSLYHDDVIDEASTRRGRVSVNANWTNTIAILSGDFLLARASEVAAPLGEEAVALIARTYASLVEGQTLELQLIDGVDHGPDEYYDVIGGKTASLIRTSARLGAMTGGAAPHQVEAVSEWGWEMGLVFQMTDDVLDLVADEAFLGKPAGSDMLEGTYTLPVLYAVAGPAGPEIRDLLARGRPDPATVARLLDIVRSGGYVDRVLDEALERARVAEKAVARAATGQLVDVFANLDRYLLDRVEAARRR